MAARRKTKTDDVEKPVPTQEQERCIEAFKTGKSLRISAYAGSGKTSVLVMLADSMRLKSGTYLAFNKSIADDAKKKFPPSVQSSTVHSMAFRAIRHRFDPNSDKMTGALNGRVLESALRLMPQELDRFTRVSGSAWGYLLSETVKKWQRSDRDEISVRDVPRFGRLSSLEDKDFLIVKKRLADQASRLWERMADPRDGIPLGHDGYLKLWALSKPIIPTKFVLLDEAQDTNGVVMGVVRAQEGQVIAVGDAQQSIYQWRGARNAMIELPAEIDCRLSMSFRFGQPIADHATEILQLLGETAPLIGNPKIKSRVMDSVHDPDCILFRTNARLIEELIARIDGDGRPYVVGGVRDFEGLLSATDKLQRGQAVDFPLEFFGFQNWQEVIDASEQEEGKDLRRWVRLIEKYGTQRLRQVFAALPKSEAAADVILSTAHKAKGRQWPKVRLSDDLLSTEKKTTDQDEDVSADEMDAELRLYYVAATRAEYDLEVPPQLRQRLGDIIAARARDQKPVDGNALPAA